MSTIFRRLTMLWMVTLLHGLIGCSRPEPSYPSYQLGKGGPKTLAQVEKIMGGPGRNMEDLAASDDKESTLPLKERYRRILKSKPAGTTIMVWKEQRGQDEWIVTMEFAEDQQTTGGGGSWLRLPGE